ncbi:MAG: LPS export ABC transporter periplasmic protein LptC [Pseudomonadota bacterium]
MRLNRKVWVVLGFSLTAILAAIALLVVDLYKTSPKTLLKVMADNVDLQVKDVIYTDVGQSGEKWEIRANTARYHKKENKVLFEKVRVKLLTPEGRIFRMTGDQGKLQTDTKDIEISGNVEILSDQGDRLRTDVLHYTHAQSAVHTDGAVTMWGGRMQIMGVGMTLNLKEGHLSLQSSVKGQIQGK